jgi:signal transduction histidine kinase
MSDEELTTCTALAIAEEVLARTRHDLRNRLSSIQNAAFYLERKSRGTPLWDEPRVPPFFEIIADEVKRAQALLGEEATVAGRWERRVARGQLAPCLARALAAARIPPGVTVETSFTETAPVEIEPTETAVIARCLIENAVEAMPDGGVLVVRSFDAEGRVAFEVQDTGGGFGALAHEEALAPFTSTKPGHTGLGLAVARRHATRAGAEIAFRPSGAGTVACVSFPRGADHA